LVSGQWSNWSGKTSASLALASDQSDVGRVIRVQAKTTDPQGGVNYFESAQQTVTNVDDAATGTLNVSGSAKEGATLSASLSNLLDADGIPTVAWQWQEQTSGGGWINLANKTLANLTIPSDQSYVGKVVRVVATTTDPLGGKTEFAGTASSAIASAAPVYSLSSDVKTVNEGAAVKFTLATQNVATGTTLTYALSGTGITSGDVDGGSLTGSMKTDASGQASVTVNLLADKLTEGAETLVLTVAGQTTSVAVCDTSTSATTAAPVSVQHLANTAACAGWQPMAASCASSCAAGLSRASSRTSRRKATRSGKTAPPRTLNGRNSVTTRTAVALASHSSKLAASRSSHSPPGCSAKSLASLRNRSNSRPVATNWMVSSLATEIAVPPVNSDREPALPKPVARSVSPWA
jgi:hypothetical protein